MPFSIENGSKINLKGPTDHWRGSLVGFALPDSILAGINSAQSYSQGQFFLASYFPQLLFPGPCLVEVLGICPLLQSFQIGDDQERSLILSYQHNLVNIGATQTGIFNRLRLDIFPIR